MSRKYQPKTKEYAQVQVISSAEAYQNNKLNPNYNFIGKIDRDMPNMVIKVNKEGKKTSFVEDTCNLTKKTKGEIVDFFKNAKTAKGNPRKKLYLVKVRK